MTGAHKAVAAARPLRVALVLGSLTGWRRLLAAAFFGALAAAALPPLYLFPLLLPAFVGVFWMLEGASAGHSGGRQAALTGWAFGTGHFAAGLYWVGIAFLVDAERFGWAMPFAVAGLAAGLALFPALTFWFTWLARQRLRLAGPALVLAFAAAWLIGEGLRAWILTGFPWNLLGTVWAFAPAPLQLAAYGGVWLLSLITVIAATAPAVLADPARRSPRGLAVVALLVLLPALAWGFGAWRLAAAPARGSDVVAEVRLRLVQPSIPQALKWRADRKAANLRLQAELSLAPGYEDRTLIIWPETAVPYLLAAEPRLREELADIVPPGAFLVSGAPRVDPADPQGKIWNALHALDGQGAIVATYDKTHLVPFGEYTPLRSLLGLAKLTAGSRDFSAGEGLKTLTLPGLPAFSPLICYEIIFPGAVKAAAGTAAPPRWLLNLTNDAWFGDSSGPYQHFAAARLRAVEEGLPVIRAANNGISAVIDSYGRVIDRINLNDRGIIDAYLPEAATERTPYSYAGNILYLIELLFTTCVIFVARRFI
ncbi:apolipoprotein N-acyltransferase [Pelagibius marinus]|uniref:apolipoprotein N-acyltransferase n=1 Tax=Pelagibius marinus TaxID=2762760 RepID=UPI001872649D|nr:apolipoprotein N-acyltransferase [Pelagibius marinus]